MKAHRIALGVVFAVGLVVACGDDDDTGATAPADAGTSTVDARPENTGRACTAPTQCYPGVDAGTLKGEVQCLTRVTGGYCTHLCQTDADCCAIPGECTNNLRQVCAPFESTGQMMCFLSCEEADVDKAPAVDAGPDAGDGGLDDNGYCKAFASPEFGCRSTGGGNKNRKVCLP